MEELTEPVAPQADNEHHGTWEDEESQSPLEVLAPLDTNIDLDLHLSISDSVVTSPHMTPTRETFYCSRNSSIETLALNETQNIFGGLSKASYCVAVSQSLEHAGLVASVARVIDGKTTEEMGPRIVEQRSRSAPDASRSSYRGHEPKRHGIVCLDHAKFKDDATYVLLYSSSRRQPSSWYSADDASLYPESGLSRQASDPYQPFHEPGAIHQDHETPRASPVQIALLEQLLHRAPTPKEYLALGRLLGCRHGNNASKDSDPIPLNRSASWTVVTDAHAPEESEARPCARESRSDPGSVGVFAWEDDDGASRSKADLDEYHFLLCQQRGLSKKSFKPSFHRYFRRDDNL